MLKLFSSKNLLPTLGAGLGIIGVIASTALLATGIAYIGFPLFFMALGVTIYNILDIAFPAKKPKNQRKNEIKGKPQLNTSFEQILIGIKLKRAFDKAIHKHPEIDAHLYRYLYFWKEKKYYKFHSYRTLYYPHMEDYGIYSPTAFHFLHGVNPFLLTHQVPDPEMIANYNQNKNRIYWLKKKEPTGFRNWMYAYAKYRDNDPQEIYQTHWNLLKIKNRFSEIQKLPTRLKDFAIAKIIQQQQAGFNEPLNTVLPEKLIREIEEAKSIARIGSP